MEKIFLTPEQLAKIPNLKADAKQADIDTAFADLVDKAAKHDRALQDLAAANAAKETAVKDLADYKKADVATKIKDLLDEANTAGKITVEQKEKLAKKYEDDYEGLKDLMGITPKQASVIPGEGLDTTKTKRIADLMAQTGEELFKNGGLEELRAIAPDQFKVKYKEWTGNEPA